MKLIKKVKVYKKKKNIKIIIKLYKIKIYKKKKKTNHHY